MKKNTQDILFSNEFMDIVMINPNYPFLQMKKYGVVTIPYDKNGNIYMLHKSRNNIGKYYELPRGFVEHKEDFQTGALRELLEETGMKAGKITRLSKVQPDTGLLSNNVEIIALEVLEKDDNSYSHYDSVDNESNLVVKLNESQINNLLLNNEIICGYTMSALFLFKTFKQYNKI